MKFMYMLALAGTLAYAEQKPIQKLLPDAIDYSTSVHIQPTVDVQPVYRQAEIVARNPDLTDTISQILVNTNDLSITPIDDEENTFTLAYGKEFSGRMTLLHESFNETYFRQIFHIDGRQHKGRLIRGDYTIVLDYTLTRVEENPETGLITADFYTRSNSRFMRFMMGTFEGTARNMLEPKLEVLINALNNTVMELQADDAKERLQEAMEPEDFERIREVFERD